MSGSDNFLVGEGPDERDQVPDERGQVPDERGQVPDERGPDEQPLMLSPCVAQQLNQCATDAEPGGGGSGGGGGKRKHRRRPSKKKRRWKPYVKLSWEEKKLLDEKESVRAAKTRAEMFAKGFTVAPYNTTQFLMEEHNQEEPDLNPGVCPAAARRAAGKADESSEEEELPDEEEVLDEQDSGSDGMGGDGSEFLQRDFCETYEKYHAESLQNMSKQELIREYLELEKCLSRLEDDKNRLRCRLDAVKATARSGDAAEKQMREIQHEVEKLKAENERLQKENELYKRERFLENGEGH